MRAWPIISARTRSSSACSLSLQPGCVSLNPRERNTALSPDECDDVLALRAWVTVIRATSAGELEVELKKLEVS